MTNPDCEPSKKSRPAALSRERLRRRLDDSLTRVRRQFASLRRRFSSHCSTGRFRVGQHRSRRSESASTVSIGPIGETTTTSTTSAVESRVDCSFGAIGCHGNNNDGGVAIEVHWSGRVYAPSRCLKNRSNQANRPTRRSAVPATVATVMMPTLSDSGVASSKRACQAYLPCNALKNATPLRRVIMPVPKIICTNSRHRQPSRRMSTASAGGLGVNGECHTTSEIIEVAVYAATSSTETVAKAGTGILELDNQSEERLDVGLEMLDQDTDSEGSLPEEPEPEPPPPPPMRFLPPQPPPPPLPSSPPSERDPEPTVCPADAAGDRGGSGGGGGGCCGCGGKANKVKRVSEVTDPDYSEFQEVQEVQVSRQSVSASEGSPLADGETLVLSQATLPPLAEEESTVYTGAVVTPIIDAAESEADSEADDVKLVGDTPRPPTSTSSGSAAEPATTSSGSTEGSDEELIVGVDGIDIAAAGQVETLHRRPYRPSLTSNPYPPPRPPPHLPNSVPVQQLAQQRQRAIQDDSSSATSEESCKPLMIAGVRIDSESASLNASRDSGSGSSSWLTQELEVSVPAMEESPKRPYQCTLTLDTTSSDNSIIAVVSTKARPYSLTSATETDSWSIEEVHAGGGHNSLSSEAVSMREWEVISPPPPPPQKLLPKQQMQQQQKQQEKRSQHQKHQEQQSKQKQQQHHQLKQHQKEQAAARPQVWPTLGHQLSNSTNTLPSDVTADRCAENSSFYSNQQCHMPSQLQLQRWSSSGSGSANKFENNIGGSEVGANRQCDDNLQHQEQQQRDSQCLTIVAPVGAIADNALRKLDMSTAMRSCSLCPVDNLPPLVNNAAATASALPTIEREAFSSSRFESSIVFQLASRILDDVDGKGRDSFNGIDGSVRGSGSEKSEATEAQESPGRPLLVVNDDMDSWRARQQTLCLIQTPPLILQARRSIQCTLSDRLQRSQRLRVHQYLLPESSTPLEHSTFYFGVVTQLMDFANISYESATFNGLAVAFEVACQILLEVANLVAIDWHQLGQPALFLAPVTLHRDDTGKMGAARDSEATVNAVQSAGNAAAGASCILRHGPVEPQLLLACDLIAGILEPAMSTKFALAAAAAPHLRIGQRNNWNASNNSADRSLSRCRRLLTRLIHRSNSSSSSSPSSTSTTSASRTSSSMRRVVSLSSRHVAEMTTQPCRSYCHAALHTSLLIIDSDSNGIVFVESGNNINNNNKNNNSTNGDDEGKNSDDVYMSDVSRRTTYFARRYVAPRIEEGPVILIEETPSRPAEATAVTTVRSRRAVELLANTRPELLWPPPFPGCRRMLSLLDETVASFIWWSLLPLRRERPRQRALAGSTKRRTRSSRSPER